MLFVTTLEQISVLFGLILLGYLPVKLKKIPENGERILSKLENYIFLPALVLKTFMLQFTVENLFSLWQILLFSLGLEIVVIAFAVLGAKLCAKDAYTGRIFLYGLSFSNFGFMGNAVVMALFPDILFEYMIFTLVLWSLIYIWGVPRLLMENPSSEKRPLAILRQFANPMLICMIIGAGIGLSGIKIPSFAITLVDAAANCMTPIAMLLTGMTLAKTDLVKLLKMKRVYAVTLLRLLVFPLTFLGLCALIGTSLPSVFVICGVVSLAMPLGLNTIVIPSAYGKDTTTASAMALISHALSLLTIPLVFRIMEWVVKEA